MTPAEVGNAQLRAYNARDIDAFVATYAPDARIHRMPDSKVLLRGRAEIAARYAGTTFKREGLRADLLGRIVVGNRVVDHEQAWGGPSGPSEVLVVYEVTGPLISAVWFYESAIPAAPVAP